MNTKKLIHELLDSYSKIQPIEVVYRPNEKVNWGRNRYTFSNGLYVEGVKGNSLKIPDYEYNHRTILDCEIVFDFDSDDLNENIENSFIVCQRLANDGIQFNVYDTGNKGFHIHTLWKDITNFKDLTLMKKTILKHYAYGMNIDYQLAGKHLVRMEYGINEKRRGNIKHPLFDEYILFYNTLLPEYIVEYQKELNKYLERRIITPVELDDSLIKDFLEGKFIVNDGREKFLFFLINNLKNRICKEELVSRLQSWYAYAGGTKLTPFEIQRKVEYHHNRGITYSFGMPYFKRLMREYKVERKE